MISTVYQMEGKFWNNIYDWYGRRNICTLNWGEKLNELYQKSQTYCCGYKNIIDTLHWHVVIFFFNPTYMYIFVLFKVDTKILKNELQLWFHLTRSLMCPLFCQEIWKDDNLLVEQNMTTFGKSNTTE